jgi:hypothetical protein
LRSSRRATLTGFVFTYHENRLLDRRQTALPAYTAHGLASSPKRSRWCSRYRAYPQHFQSRSRWRKCAGLDLSVDLNPGARDSLPTPRGKIREVDLASILQLEDPVDDRSRAHLTDSPNHP